MTEPTQGSRPRMSDDDIARNLVFSAGFGIMETTEDLLERFDGRGWKPPAEMAQAVEEVDIMIAMLDQAIVHARILMIRALDYPGEPDLEAFEEVG